MRKQSFLINALGINDGTAFCLRLRVRYTKGDISRAIHCKEKTDCDRQTHLYVPSIGNVKSDTNKLSRIRTKDKKINLFFPSSMPGWGGMAWGFLYMPMK